MDAWEILISNSTLQSGDVWEHLNNQTGGGGSVVVDGTTSAQIIDSLSSNSVVESLIAIVTDTASTSISDSVLTAVVEEILEA
jgi:hypothetical protein